MAILDAFIQFSDAQAITTSVASTNIIDTLSELGDAMESGVWLKVAVQTTFAGGTSLQAQLQTADDTDFNVGAVTLVQSAAINVADLVAGKEMLVVKLPKNCKRYLRVYYPHVGDVHTAGNVDAHVTTNVDSLITDVEGT
jgi:hypothetical protein